MNQMNCSEVTRQLQPLLEDLLQEAEYQAFHAHLKSCTACREHVRAINSIADGIQALGDVEPPGDLEEAILFRLRQEPGVRPGRGAGHLGSPSAGWLPLAGLAFLAVVAGLWYASRPRPSRAQEDPPVSVRATIVRPTASDQDAEVALGQLKAIARRLGVDDSGAETASPGDGSRAAPLRWRLRLRPAEQPALLKALEGSGAEVEYQVDGMLLFSALRGALPTVAERVEAMPGALQPGDALALSPVADGTTVWILIELTGS